MNIFVGFCQLSQETCYELIPNRICLPRFSPVRTTTAFVTDVCKGGLIPPSIQFRVIMSIFAKNSFELNCGGLIFSSVFNESRRSILSFYAKHIFLVFIEWSTETARYGMNCVWNLYHQNGRSTTRNICSITGRILPAQNKCKVEDEAGVPNI